MNTINEINNTIDQLSLNVERLDGSELIHKMVKKFCKQGKYTFPLWDCLEEKASIFDPDGWKAISGFHPNSEKFLFIEPEESNLIFYFKSSEDIINALENCYAFIFYITNVDLDYLISFNDHNYLIGCGLAKDWIHNLISKNNELRKRDF